MVGVRVEKFCDGNKFHSPRRTGRKFLHPPPEHVKPFTHTPPLRGRTIILTCIFELKYPKMFSQTHCEPSNILYLQNISHPISTPPPGHNS